MNSEGFTFIGLGVMILLICHGCNSCVKTKVEVEIMKAQQKVENAEKQ